MRVSFISDLHVDLNRRASINAYRYELSLLLEEEESDLLVIGGDISNNVQTTLDFVEVLEKDVGIPVYFIPGNHDFWEDSVKKDTWGLYRIYQQHPQSLVESPLKLTDEYSLVGHPAWYNHAVYDKNKYNEEEIELGKYRFAYWQDKLNLDWQGTDREVSKHFAEIIKKDLEKVETDKIILQTHMITIPEFTMPMPHKIFDFFNAYIATDDLEGIHKKYPISHQFMGHVHFRAQVKKEGSRFITNSLGYRREWRSKSLRQELKNAIITIEI